jgi:hypothetical protein
MQHMLAVGGCGGAAAAAGGRATRTRARARAHAARTPPAQRRCRAARAGAVGSDAGSAGDALPDRASRIAQSLAAAESACEDATADAAACATAWEEVMELRVADADAARDEPGGAAAPATSPLFTRGAQARGMPDPLAGVRPSQIAGSTALGPPTGSLQKRGELERMARAAGAPPPQDASRLPKVKQALEASVQEAVAACETGTPADCAVAWDEARNDAQRLSWRASNVRVQH